MKIEKYFSAAEIDAYFFSAAEEAEKQAERQAEKQAYIYAGGYEASRGDYEGACLARAEFESGVFS